MVDYFQVIEFFVGNCGIPSGLSSFFIKCLDIELVKGISWDMLAFFSEILIKTNFKDEIQLKWGRVVKSSFEKFFFISGWWTVNESSKGIGLQGNSV